MSGGLPASIATLALAATAPMAAGTEPAARGGFAIEITEPKDQEIVFGRTRIAATVRVAESSRIDRVEFLVGDEVVFVDREAPWECIHNFGEATRSFIVRAVAYHEEEVSVSDTVVTRKMLNVAIEQVNRVILWMSATDQDRHFVTDLAREDFRILEDGVPQALLEFHAEDRPLNIAILLDTSGSMVGRIDEVHAAAAAFVDALRPDDRALVIDFNDKVFLIQELTGDRELLKEAITSTTALGGTAIFDALHAAYRKLDAIVGRRVIVLLSDGTDSASQFSFERVSEEARSRDVLVYSIALGGGTGDPPRKRVLQEFSDVTGGRFYFVKTAPELGDVYRRIAEELGRQYYLTYSTRNEVWDGRWIKVDVETVRPGIEIRSRRGYFAVRRDLR